MSRLPRIVVPGLPHPVVHRGVRRCDIFLEDSDRIVYERMLKERSDRYGVDLFSYCWMSNHIHLIATPEGENSLGEALRDTHGLYATYFNRKYGHSGHLWQSRFFSCVLDESHFWTAIRYVEQNPVPAGITKRAEDYRWSSARAHCGLREDPLLKPLPSDSRLILDWAGWLADEPMECDFKVLRHNTRTGRPLGSKAFLDELENRMEKKVRPRRRGRKKGEISQCPLFSPHLSAKASHVT